MESEINFCPGDIVTLKSGGPPMTISCINETKTLHCVWYVEVENVYRRENLSPAALQKSSVSCGIV